MCGSDRLQRRHILQRTSRSDLAVQTLEGVEEEGIVDRLLDLRDGVMAPGPVAIEGARGALLNLVNGFFRENLMAMLEVRTHIGTVGEVTEDELRVAPASGW